MGRGGMLNREWRFLTFFPLKGGGGAYLRGGDLEKIYGSLFIINKIIKMLKILRGYATFFAIFLKS